jgi:hypothetical protein
MAAKKYFVDIDLNKNQLVNTVLEKTTEAVANTGAVEGQVIFDTGSKTLKYFDGQIWQSTETRLEGALQYKGPIAFDAAAPSNPQKGDLYVFNTPGTATNFGTPAPKVEVGDFAIYSGSGWDIIQGNTDIVQATTSVAGIVRLATDQETIDGTDATIAITPDGFNAWAAQTNNIVARKKIYNITIKNDGTSVINLSYSGIPLTTPDIMVYNAAGEQIEVLVEYIPNLQEPGTSATIKLTVNGSDIVDAKVVVVG